METYATVLSFAIPGFVLLILIEYLASRLMNQDIANSMDTISSLSSGMTNTLKDILGLAVVIVGYGWMVEHIALTKITSTTTTYIVAFILIDFAAYWSHRFNHTINVFWNRHIVHHSSEEFNLSCALRQSISAIVGVYFFLSIPMALLGIPASVLAITAPLHLFAQFWYHTRLIKNMGFLEYIIVTPSHHRVHHAINAEYIDKNYAAIFIIWDRMFGTYQEEMVDVPPVYGVKKPVRTWNPFVINYTHLWLLITDAWYTNNLWDKIRIWFMPTGWRPEDVARSRPIHIEDDVYAIKKYMPTVPSWLKSWSWAQLIITNLLMYFMLSHIADFDASALLLYGAFLAATIFAYTSLMDGHPIAIVAEVIKVSLGIYILGSTGHWFGIDSVLSGGSWMVSAYMAVSLGATIYFTFVNKSSQSTLPQTI